MPDAPLNSIDLQEEILSLKHDEFSKKLESATFDIVEKRKKSLSQFLNALHTVWGGETKRMHQDVKNEIFAHLANSNEKMGKKYTNEDLFKSAFEVLRKYNKPVD